MLSMIITIVLIALFIYGIIKKLNPAMLLIIISVITLGVWQLVTGTSVMGENSTGSLFIDLFELIYATAKTQVAGALLVIMSVLGYVEYMNSIKASEYLASIVAKPLRKINKPYLLATAVIVLGTILKLAIPSSLSMIVMLLAIVYPILIQLGVSRATAASAIMLSGFSACGPGDVLSTVIFGMAEVKDKTVPEFFISHHIPITLALLLVLMIVFPLISIFFDKREKDTVTEEAQSIQLEEFSLPKIYALLPLIPLVLIITFSKVVVGSIVISVVAANLISLVVSMIIHTICKKDLIGGLNSTRAFFNGMGRFFGNAGFILIAGAVFSSAITRIGGLTYLVNLIRNAGASPIILTFVACLIVFPVAICTGSVTAIIPLFLPLFMDIATSTGTDVFTLFTVLIYTLGLASPLSPVAASVIAVSERSSVQIPTILKRNFIPLFACLLVLVPACFILL